MVPIRRAPTPLRWHCRAGRWSEASPLVRPRHACKAKRAAADHSTLRTGYPSSSGLDCRHLSAADRCAAQALDYPGLPLRPSPISVKHAKQARSRRSTYPLRIGVLTQYSQSITRPCPLETRPALLSVGMLRTAKLRCIRQTTRCRRALCGTPFIAISACGLPFRCATSACTQAHTHACVRTHARTGIADGVSLSRCCALRVARRMRDSLVLQRNTSTADLDDPQARVRYPLLFEQVPQKCARTRCYARPRSHAVPRLCSHRDRWARHRHAAYDLMRFSLQEFYEVTLSAGTQLFIPKGWWHLCTSTTPSFSVSHWWL